jgi:hypothetical protein
LARLAIMIVLTAAIPLAGALAAETDSAKAPRLICRTAKQTTGSHIRAPRRCHSEEEWQRIDEAAARIPVSMRVNSSKNEGGPTRAQ